MMVETNRKTLRRLFRTQVQQRQQVPLRSVNVPRNVRTRHDESTGMGFIPPPSGAGGQSGQPRAPQVGKAQPIIVGDKVGRNDPCPCGSGKKYKKCHGRMS